MLNMLNMLTSVARLHLFNVFKELNSFHLSKLGFIPLL